MMSYKEWFKADIERLVAKRERMIELGLNDIANEIDVHLAELEVFLQGVE